MEMPILTPLTDATGRMSRAWVLYFQAQEQELGTSTDTSSVRTALTNMQEEIDALESGSLGVGRDL